MIIAIASGKGSPGATTLAVLLGLCWNGPRLVLELDSAGADLPYRLPGAEGRPLAASPSIATLAVESRPGGPLRTLEMFAQQTALGLPVIVGETSPTRADRLAGHLPAISHAAASWDGTVFADLGRFLPSNPALVAARAAHVLVVVVRADTEGLGHLRDRVEELTAEVGGGSSSGAAGGRVAVVVRAGRRDEAAAARRVDSLLASVGSPASALGVLPDDPAAAAALWAGPPTRRVARSRLVGAARDITTQLATVAVHPTGPPGSPDEHLRGQNRVPIGAQAPGQATGAGR